MWQSFNPDSRSQTFWATFLGYIIIGFFFLMLKKLSIHNHMAKGFYNSLKGMLLPHPSLFSTSPTHLLLYNISNQTFLFISWSQPSWFSFSHHPSHCLHTASWRSKPKWPLLPWKSQNAQCTGLHNVYVLLTNSICGAISQILGFRTVTFIKSFYIPRLHTDDFI